MISFILKGTIISLFILSYIFMMSLSNPMTMGILVIFQSVFLAVLSSMKFNFNWFSFLLFLIYLGGILMIFSYIISISLSDKPIEKFKPWMIMLFLLSMSLFSEKESFLEFKKIKLPKLIFSIYSEMKSFTIFLMILLFMIMTSVILITEKQMLNLKKK
uniref:NADH dehydrogenase subunit 6 n=1 Tax=Frankliniella intonsa TaxID=163893 RepID=UPI00286B9551|nr:NADH dehydrogenase subunit 6 [Frankliniella intonsa]WKD81347.1 NADH dehydrogenase subunit 6 [Frankliniella intonsa]WKD81386.1 NADH dehydrogenase subunit 6 [Frankliniella intonsa]WKD81399.1 NADH dehydrogenase subunit 6 [Frankliniella intonsa]WKD81503.1 NADH dehydrogenase subunit 6 [Frankliniella intonsa]WKD81542.1 NADH dehydrogenase subunit 6 [Frankliniella intonsa]